MCRFIHLSLLLLLCSHFTRPAFAALHDPDLVATVVIDGIDTDGPTAGGIVGIDVRHSLIDEMADLMSIPTGTANPIAPNQITMTSHYGDRYPSYYSSADRSDVDQLTDKYGGGIPRYASIVAKFCREVLRRSGARQVNIVGLSMGAYVGRWMIENDYENLASRGRIARFITVEGVVCGNWACNAGGSVLNLIDNDYYLRTIDIQQMKYDWLEDNLHDPHTEMDNALYAKIQVSHWASTDDDENNRALTIASGKPNDGVQVYGDTYFHDVTSRSKYNGRRPTLSHIYATHNTAREHEGIRAGLIADLTSTRRVRITLRDAKIENLPESGTGEVIFGCKIESPLARARYGISAPVNQIDNLGHTIDPVKMKEDDRVTIDQVLFDDFVLPGEKSLTIDFEVREIDFDTFYGILENPFHATDTIGSNDVSVSTLASKDYSHDNSNWNGKIRVEVIDYPAFVVNNSAADWMLY